MGIKVIMPDISAKVADIIDNIRRVFQVVNELSKLAEKETGVTGPQLWAIRTISEFGPLKGADLAKRMYLHPTTVVGILDRLEASGLVQRTRSKIDRRVVEIELTEQGKDLVATAPEVFQGQLVKGLESLPAEKLLKIYDGLEELVGILGAKEVAPRLMFSNEVNLPKKPKK
jgi:DNA-binding MarR family transcriptional regulator